MKAIVSGTISSLQPEFRAINLAAFAGMSTSTKRIAQCILPIRTAGRPEGPKA
jgi:hypothetical protein